MTRFRFHGRLIAAVAVAAGLASRPALARAGERVFDAEFLKAHRRPLDWKVVARGPERVIYIGETHGDPTITSELAAHMKEIRAAGITHLALENWSEDYQASVLDRYSRRELDDDDLLAVFKRWARENDGGATTDATMPISNFQNYIHVMHEAREAGIGLVAPDMPREQLQEMGRICDGSPRPKQCSDDPLIHDRDVRIASNLTKVLGADPQARILALLGSWHAAHEFQPTALLRYGWGSRSYIAACGADSCSQAIQKLDLFHERLFIDTSVATHGAHAPVIEISRDGDDEQPPMALHYDGCIDSPGVPGR